MAKLDSAQLAWTRKPSMFILSDEKIILETEPFSSARSTVFSRTSAFGLYFEKSTPFEFSLRADFKFEKQEDECGIFLKAADDRWIRFGLSLQKNDLDMACDLYHAGTGDHSVVRLSSGIRWMYLKMNYWNGNVRFSYSFNGEKYTDMRWLDISSGRKPVQAGFYACSPEESSYDCTFTCMDIREI
ncbi:MAG: DUF1349 domain-containing protein [Solobacterium sp.]|nr:DUF1349 domain-containing protein [Solobacterium sp.]